MEVFIHCKDRISTEEYLKTLTPEQRAKREAGLKRAEEIEAEVSKLGLPPRQHNEEVNRRLRAELPEETQKELQEFDEEISRMIKEREEAAARHKEEHELRRKQLEEWKNAGEAPNVGLFFESFAMEAPVQAFYQSTGIFVGQAGVRDGIIKFRKTGYLPFMLSCLDKLKKLAFLSAIGDKYAAGKISSPLLDILKITPQFPQIKNAEDFRNADPAEYIGVFYANHPEALAPFKKEHDIEPNWYSYHRISIAPFYAFNYYGDIDNMSVYAKNQKTLLSGQISATITAAFDSQYNPLSESSLKEFIDFLRTIERNPEQGIRGIEPPSAYLNVLLQQIYDLRPYEAELQALFQIPDFSFIGDLADLLEKQIEERRVRQQEEMNSGNEILQSLFPEVFYYPPETAKDFRNLPVSKPERLLIRSYANARINGQSIELTDGNDKVLQQLQFTDLNGNLSQEVIRPFDISIMNCIGSLQQKYATRKGFTDIEIAKEFNSTLDKKGNITPDSKIVLEVRESMRRLSVTFGSIDITQQIELEMSRRKPDTKRIDRLKKGSSVFGLQHLVNVQKVVIHTLKNDKDTLLYFIDGSPLFYLHAAITHQIAQVPFSQMNSRKNLTTEIRLLREYTRIALETAISMRKRKLGGSIVRFNPIIDATFRTSADTPEDPTKVEMTELVKNIPAWKRYKLQEQIRTYLDELIQHKFITGYTILKKKLPGKQKQVDYGFSFTLPEDPANKK